MTPEEHERLATERIELMADIVFARLEVANIKVDLKAAIWNYLNLEEKLRDMELQFPGLKGET